MIRASASRERLVDLPPEGEQVEADLRQDAGTVLGAGRQGDHESTGLVDQELDLALAGIDDPVLLDPAFGVERELLPAVAPAGAGRELVS